MIYLNKINSFKYLKIIHLILNYKMKEENKFEFENNLITEMHIDFLNEYSSTIFKELENNFLNLSRRFKRKFSCA